MRVLFLNGPNLNMLGEREESLYGQLTLSEINDLIQKKADCKRCHSIWNYFKSYNWQQNVKSARNPQRIGIAC